MAGRNYLPPDSMKLRDTHPHRALIDDPHPPPPRQHLVEDRIAAQHREIQLLLSDNQRLAATHVALKQELAVAEQDLRHFSSVAVNVKADRDLQVREVYERAMKMEAEVRLIDEMSAELAQVRGDVQQLSSERKELDEKLAKVDGELAKAKSEANQIPMIKADIEAMQKEIQKGRAAIEYEKKVHASNIEQSQAMEKHLISMSREIEKLQAELANAEKRARAAAAAAAAATPGGYNSGYGTAEMGYGGHAYPGPYAGYQDQGGIESHYGPGGVPHGAYDMHHHNVHR